MVAVEPLRPLLAPGHVRRLQRPQLTMQRATCLIAAERPAQQRRRPAAEQPLDAAVVVHHHRTRRLAPQQAGAPPSRRSRTADPPQERRTNGALTSLEPGRECRRRPAAWRLLTGPPHCAVRRPRRPDDDDLPRSGDCLQRPVQQRAAHRPSRDVLSPPPIRRLAHRQGRPRRSRHAPARQLRLTPDGGHRPRRLQEARVVDAVPGSFRASRSPSARRSRRRWRPPQWRAQVGLGAREQAVAHLAVGGQPDPVAGGAERAVTLAMMPTLRGRR